MAGQLLIVAAPSGAGKTSLVQALLSEDKELRLSVSYTTRAPRPGEIHGMHYDFVNRAAFDQLVADGQLLEYAEVHGHFYGTGRQRVESELAQSLDVLLEIDWQGARQVCQRFPGTHSVFILPPSRVALMDRLQKRGQDSQEVIARRLANARGEIAHCLEFDYLIVNDDFNRALADLRAIVHAVRLKRAAQVKRQQVLIEQLLA